MAVKESGVVCAQCADMDMAVSAGRPRARPCPNGRTGGGGFRVGGSVHDSYTFFFFFL